MKEQYHEAVTELKSLCLLFDKLLFEQTNNTQASEVTYKF
jgi:hypothetical protein